MLALWELWLESFVEGGRCIRVVEEHAVVVPDLRHPHLSPKSVDQCLGEANPFGALDPLTALVSGEGAINGEAACVPNELSHSSTVRRVGQRC